MDYQLCKKLKDAGFPQNGNGGWFPHGDDATEEGSHCYVPTLSELIESCGEDFIELEKILNKWYCKGKWEKFGDGLGYYPKYDVDGSTSEEAVALLWIELHKTKIPN